MQSTSLFLLGLVLLLVGTNSCSIVAQTVSGFSFFDLLQGEWNVTKATVGVKSHEQIFEPVQGHYRFEAENGSLALIGRYYENDATTGDIITDITLTVDFTDSNSGVFQTGDNEFDVKPLFKFDVYRAPNSLQLSFGEWLGEHNHGGLYELTVAFDRFIITVFPPTAATPGADGEEPQIHLILAEKIPKVSPPTFFQKYGTTIMIVGFFGLQMWLKSKQDGYGAAGNASRAAALRRPGGVDGQAPVRPSSAQVEEIPDGDEDRDRANAEGAEEQEEGADAADGDGDGDGAEGDADGSDDAPTDIAAKKQK